MICNHLAHLFEKTFCFFNVLIRNAFTPDPLPLSYFSYIPPNFTTEIEAVNFRLHFTTLDNVPSLKTPHLFVIAFWNTAA